MVIVDYRLIADVRAVAISLTTEDKAMDTEEKYVPPQTDVEFDALIKRLRAEKPKEPSELGRRYAIVLTELEQAYAYYLCYIRGVGGPR